MDAERYKNVSTTEMYLRVDIDVSEELDSSRLRCSRKAYGGKEERYDAQYAHMEELRAGERTAS